MITRLVNTLTEAQMDAWVSSISNRGAVQIDEEPQRGMGIWKCSFEVEGQPYDIFYAGPSAREGNSFLVCRDFAIAGIAYKQGIRQLTEHAHRGHGLGRWLLQSATYHYGVLVSDDAGMTVEAYGLWSNPKNGIAVEAIDIETGARQPNKPQLFSAWPATKVDVLILTAGTRGGTTATSALAQ